MPFWHRVLCVTIEVLRFEVQILNDVEYACGYKNESGLHIENGLKSATPEPEQAGCFDMSDADCCM